MRDKQERVKEHCDQRRGAERVFRVGDRVYVKTVRGELVSLAGRQWLTQGVSAVTYGVKVHNRFRFVHADHPRSVHAGTSTKVDDAERPENRIPPAEPAPSNLSMPSDTSHESRGARATGSQVRQQVHRTSTLQQNVPCLRRLRHNPKGRHRLHLPLQGSVSLRALTTKRCVVARGFGSHQTASNMPDFRQVK
ncbi:hypothetical protein MTO96_025058 [Rhipicephalus appendiculatus]